MACEISPILFPAFANFMPSKKACFVVSTSLLASEVVFPTIYVLAQSPWNPFLYTTKSTLTMSPSFKISFLEGIPWITTSFIEIHKVAGNGATPFS